VPEDTIDVHVALTFNEDNTVNIAFERIDPDELGSLLASVGTEEFARKLHERLQELVEARRDGE
jgi:hypothetical protein